MVWGAIAGAVLGSGLTKSSGTDAQSQGQSKSGPVVIPRYPAVMPHISTGQGSRISVTPGYNTDQLAGNFGGMGGVGGGFSGHFGGAVGRRADYTGDPQGGLRGTINNVSGVPTMTGVFNPTVKPGGSTAPEKPTAKDYELVSNPVRHGGGDAWDRVKEGLRRDKYNAAKGRIDEWNSWLAGEGGPKTTGGEVQGPAVEALTGLGIQVNIDPSIARTRGELFTNLEGLKGNVNTGLQSIGQQITDLRAMELPPIDVAGFDQIGEWGDTQRGQLLNIDQNLSQQIGHLDQMYQRLGQNEGSFIEARTSQMQDQRARAHRDATRRGISGPLAVLATNPFDVAIADEAAKAQMDVEQARIQVREQQRMVEETRIGVQQQFEQVRLGQLQAIGDKFAQTAQQFDAGLSREDSIMNAQQLVQGGQALIQSIIEDQSGLAQQALQQEFAELGLGAEIYQMIIESQLVTPTAQISESSQSSSSRPASSPLGSLFGEIF